MSYLSNKNNKTSQITKKGSCLIISTISPDKWKKLVTHISLPFTNELNDEFGC